MPSLTTSTLYAIFLLGFAATLSLAKDHASPIYKKSQHAHSTLPKYAHYDRSEAARVRQRALLLRDDPTAKTILNLHASVSRLYTSIYDRDTRQNHADALAKDLGWSNLRALCEAKFVKSGMHPKELLSRVVKDLCTHLHPDVKLPKPYLVQESLLHLKFHLTLLPIAPPKSFSPGREWSSALFSPHFEELPLSLLYYIWSVDIEMFAFYDYPLAKGELPSVKSLQSLSSDDIDIDSISVISKELIEFDMDLVMAITMSPHNTPIESDALPRSIDHKNFIDALKVFIRVHDHFKEGRDPNVRIIENMSRAYEALAKTVDPKPAPTSLFRFFSISSPRSSRRNYVDSTTTKSRRPTFQPTFKSPDPSLYPPTKLPPTNFYSTTSPPVDPIDPGRFGSNYWQNNEKLSDHQRYLVNLRRQIALKVVSILHKSSKSVGPGRLHGELKRECEKMKVNSSTTCREIIYVLFNITYTRLDLVREKLTEPATVEYAQYTEKYVGISGLNLAWSSNSTSLPRDMDSIRLVLHLLSMVRTFAKLDPATLHLRSTHRYITHLDSIIRIVKDTTSPSELVVWKSKRPITLLAESLTAWKDGVASSKSPKLTSPELIENNRILMRRVSTAIALFLAHFRSTKAWITFIKQIIPTDNVPRASSPYAPVLRALTTALNKPPIYEPTLPKGRITLCPAWADVSSAYALLLPSSKPTTPSRIEAEPRDAPVKLESDAKAIDEIIKGMDEAFKDARSLALSLPDEATNRANNLPETLQTAFDAFDDHRLRFIGYYLGIGHRLLCPDAHPLAKGDLVLLKSTRLQYWSHVKWLTSVITPWDLLEKSIVLDKPRRRSSI